MKIKQVESIKIILDAFFVTFISLVRITLESNYKM
jgi:hypothetical protein